MKAVTIRTATRTTVDLQFPTVTMIKLRDIAHALAQINRFTGHTPGPYSVAEHSIIGSHVIGGRYALEFLLHDAPEAYLGDVNAPLKSLLGDVYRNLEDGFDAAIAVKFGLRPDAVSKAAVKRVDKLMLACEQDVFMGSRMSIRDLEANSPDAQRVFSLLRRRSGEDMERAFLLRFAELVRQRS